MSASPVRLADVHGTPVYVGDTRVGSVGDVFADAGRLRVVGLGISRSDGSSRFLPWAAARLESGTVRSSTPLAFLAAHELEYYATHAVRLDPEERARLGVHGDGTIVQLQDGPEPGVLAAAREGIPKG